MIIVIADDITGAAELAGIGLRYGLRVKMAADVIIDDQIDLLVLYSNTRSLMKGQAINKMKELTLKAGALKPLFIYKKTDSVLRGYVLAEIQVQMEALGVDKALLVPANPDLGRTIESGRYYINGQPLHETSFSGDPEFPAKTNLVREVLTAEDNTVLAKRPGDELANGVNVGEAKSKDDVKKWAGYQRENILLAGGGFFFDVLLASCYSQVVEPKDEKVQHPVLFVSGTAFRKESGILSENEGATSFMPEELFYNVNIDKDGIQEWSKEIVVLIREQKKAFVAIGEKERGDSGLLRMKIAAVVKSVFEQCSIRELIIEGGSTAFSVIGALGWKQFTPYAELSFGVVKLKVDNTQNVFLTIKPGSYPWPPSWEF